jgi:hypothetical protein
MKRKSMIALLVALSICLSVIVPGCSLFDKSKDEISETVEEYLDDIKSGAFAQNDYRSDLVTDKPFSLMKFKDEGLRDCMKASLSMIDYKVKEANGNTSDKTGECLVSITHVDLDEVVQSFGKEWITVESLTNKLTAADAPKKTDDVLLFMEYDDIEKIWRVSASSEIAITLGKPYADINLYTGAGDPQDVLGDLLLALQSGEDDKIKEFFTNKDLVAETVTDEEEDKVRNEFFLKCSIVPGDTEFGEEKCTVEAVVEYPNFDEIWAKVSLNVELYCEMLKFQLTELHGDPSKASMDVFYSLLEELFLEEMKNPDMVMIEDTVRFEMIISAEGDRWVIKNIPDFIKSPELEEPSVAEQTLRTATAIAAVELYEEGVLTKKERDSYLKKYDMTQVKYSSRKVRDAITRFEIFDTVAVKKTDVFSSGNTKHIGMYFEFNQTFKGLVVTAVVLDSNGGRLVGEYVITVVDDFPDGISASLVFDDDEIWPDGEYKLIVIGQDMLQIGEALEFKVQ